ncbi:MAG: MYXO-CTERM sorting domain-containing protein [Nannocystaceae bacterium]
MLLDRGCTCRAQSPAGGSAAWGLLPLLVLVTRRRRR